MVKTLKWITRLIVTGGAAFGLGFVAFAWSIHHKQTPDLQRADGIVVLTGGRARIPEAVRLLSADHGKRLLISGVNQRTTKQALLHHAPGRAALFDCCIDVGYEARDTIGNANETRDWVTRHGFRTLIVVTSSYHMPRSLIELRRVLPDIDFHPHVVVAPSVRMEAWWSHPGTAQLLFTEYLKYLPAAGRFYAARLFGIGERRNALAGA